MLHWEKFLSVNFRKELNKIQDLETTNCIGVELAV